MRASLLQRPKTQNIQKHWKNLMLAGAWTYFAACNTLTLALEKHHVWGWHMVRYVIMAFTGKYELETQENYEEFLEAVGLLNAKTDYKVVTEVLQDGNNFTWTQTIPNWTWSNKFIVGQECELNTMRGSKFKAPVTMEGGKISVQFPEYHFTAEIVDDKLVMICVIPGEKGVTFKRINKRI